MVEEGSRSRCCVKKSMGWVMGDGQDNLLITPTLLFPGVMAVVDEGTVGAIPTRRAANVIGRPSKEWIRERKGPPRIGSCRTDDDNGGNKKEAHPCDGEATEDAAATGPTPSSTLCSSLSGSSSLSMCC